MDDGVTDSAAEFLALLWEAFSNESAASVFYRYYSMVAKIEGYPKVAEGLREMAESLDCLAQGHFDVLRYEPDPVSGLPRGDTLANLAGAMHSLSADASVRYVELRQRARDAGLEDVASWLDTVIALKRQHAGRLAAAFGEVSAQDPAEAS